MSMSKRNIIWLLMAFFFIADLAAAVHKGKKEVVGGLSLKAYPVRRKAIVKNETEENLKACYF